LPSKTSARSTIFKLTAIIETIVGVNYMKMILTDLTADATEI